MPIFLFFENKVYNDKHYCHLSQISTMNATFLKLELSVIF